MIAMADLKNLDVRQQIKDSDKWLENAKIWKDGMEGLYTENPGNFKSQTLNQITASISNAYQKVKDSMNRRNAKLRKLVQNLKDEKNFGYVKNNLTNIISNTHNDKFCNISISINLKDIFALISV